MADVFTKAKRSEVMSQIPGRGNKDTELALVKLLRRNRITGWRRNQPVFGKPDQILFSADSGWRCSRTGVSGTVAPFHATKPRHNATFW